MLQPAINNSALLKLPKVIAHRGASAYAPENTLAAFRKARELNVAWIEFDVALTADNTAMVLHDETLERTTNGKGEIAKLTAREVASLDAGSWFSPQYSAEKIPSLLETLLCAKALELGINVEIKPTTGRDKETAEGALAILQKYWNQADQLLVSSFSVVTLHAARAINASVNLGLLVHEWFEGWQQQLENLRCVSLNANHEILNQEIVGHLKVRGYYVLAYTVDDVERAKLLFSWGVDAVFSNIPDIINAQVVIPTTAVFQPELIAVDNSSNK